MPSILKGSYRPSINGGVFQAITNTTYHATRPAITGIERLMAAVSPNAFYNSDNRSDPPKCHENTRVAVITKITNWVTSKQDTDAFILWLYGPAGAGKTAIARKVAELCEAEGLLLASFLFFRSDPKRNTMNPLVANIAYCVGRVIHRTKELIEIAIEADPLILTYSIEVQLTKLVLEPLRLLADQGYFLSGKFARLVVIDGLDECLDQGAQASLIQFLASAVARNQLPLKFLIVSRPEAHIKLAIALASQQTTFSRLGLNDDFQADEDIRYFLTDKFREIKMCHPFRSGIPSFWPSEQQMVNLIRKASGQFIYASLAVRFINSACDSPMRQLDIILGLRPPINHDLPFAELDSLYTFILSCTKNVDLVLHILGVHSVLQVPPKTWDTTVKTIESVLYLEDGDVRIYLSPLNSLLEISYEGDGQYGPGILFHHTSFTDFLDNPERSKGYCIDAPTCHSLIAQWILQVLTSNNPRRGIDQWWFSLLDLVRHLEHSIWTHELEHALEVFSLSTYLNWFDYSFKEDEQHYYFWYTDFPEKFLRYLGHKGKTGLYRYHLLCYMDHLRFSIKNPPSREKFRLMSAVWFVLQKPIASQWSGIGAARWEIFCAKIFGFNESEIHQDYNTYRLMRDPTRYGGAGERPYNLDGTMYGLLDETKLLIPEPILSHRVDCIALSCLQYLLRQDPNNFPLMQGNLLAAWAMKSKRMPWLWRQRIRVTSIGRRQPNWYIYRPKYSLPDSLRRSRQMLYSRGIQSQDFYLERHIFYMWTLDLLYHTLRTAMKSDELIKALSEPFIPPIACILFPCRIQQVQKAVGAYLEKFDPSSLDASGVKQIVRRCTKYRPQRNVVCDSISSKQVLSPDRDVAEQQLSRNIGIMLDLVYGPTGGHPKTIASVNDVFDRVNKLGREIETLKAAEYEGGTEAVWKTLVTSM